MTIVLLLYFDDKDLEKIQQIVTSTKAVNFAKCVVGAKANLALMAKKKQTKKAAKSKLGEEYFNYRKKGYYAKDSRSSISNKRKLEKSIEEAKCSWWNTNQAKVTKSMNNNQDDFNYERYPVGQAYMTWGVDEDQSKV